MEPDGDRSVAVPLFMELVRDDCPQNRPSTQDRYFGAASADVGHLTASCGARFVLSGVHCDQVTHPLEQ